MGLRARAARRRKPCRVPFDRQRSMELERELRRTIPRLASAYFAQASSTASTRPEVQRVFDQNLQVCGADKACRTC